MTKDKNIEKAKEEFKDKWRELTLSGLKLHGNPKAKDSKVVYFGYKTRRGDEIFTVLDWSNMWSFIEQKIKEAEERGREG